MTKVAEIERFPVERVNIRREFDNIDLLIENDQQKQAVVIENKIWAGDQERQLQRYHNTLLDSGYPEDGIRLIYLTLFGDSPSEQSIGNLKCKELSYRDDLLQWLKRCQERAFDDPALRESIAQYRELVMKLTNTDRSAEYMAELKNLCLTENNLILAHELSQALIEAKSELICELGKAIGGELARIEGFPLPDDRSLIEYDNVRECLVSKYKKYLGLSYKINQDAQFVIGAGNDELWYGICCSKEHAPECFAQLKEISYKVASKRYFDKDDPWYRYVEINNEGQRLDIRQLNPEGLSLLQSEKRRGEIAEMISTQLAELWHEIKKNDPT